MGGQGGAFGLGVEGSGRRLECLWGLVGSYGVLWRSCRRVLKSAALVGQGRVFFTC